MLHRRASGTVAVHTFAGVHYFLSWQKSHRKNGTSPRNCLPKMATIRGQCAPGWAGFT
ncbi:hypothetical protein CHELA20_52117 [Hyphomicrobiales bacterium]|nr:hypothetical protein CHELA41_22803 [Hyphomicrobiales bacterium]CAH1680698.1 hypothetical protein CHELA20_52117 [Hyphomicrobiales bacterium]